MNRGAYVYLYIRDMGKREAVDTNSNKDNVYRFSWGLDNEMSVLKGKKISFILQKLLKLE